MKKYFIIMFCCIVSFILAFKVSNTYEPHKYVEIISKHNGPYYSTRQFGKLIFKIGYMPNELSALSESYDSKRQPQFDSEKYSKLLEENQGYKNFILEINNNTSKDLLKEMVSSSDEYSDLINYLSFDIQKDIFLCFSKDTVRCNFAHFERVYGLAPYVKINFGFNFDEETEKKLEKSDNWTILFNAQHFNYGKLYFPLRSNEFLKNPIIKF